MDNWKNTVDITAVGGWLVGVITGFINMLPPVIAFLTSICTLIWVVFRLWEMETTKKMVKWARR